ncbi:hypothetical protein [uncultured Pelagimonas sp.]|uniref:DUF1127 domain-containing protein n=1 Tax=uncultured Pelagimonas sp. TaxID=1618102 RepID=UPI0026351AD4|nr:hypothetical protein [uncultured Pelagimonas sp.]
MAHIRTTPFGSLLSLARQFTRYFAGHPSQDKPQADLLVGLPNDMSDHHLRDIGLTHQQIYLYRARSRTPLGF